MSDLELQDIRDLYNKQKAERDKHDELLRKIKMFSQNPELLKEDPQMLEYLNRLTTAKQKDKKQEEKVKRLGLDKGVLLDFGILMPFELFVWQGNHRAKAELLLLLSCVHPSTASYTPSI